jgi:hypothetical protein
MMKMVLLVQVLYWIWYRNSTPKFFREFAEIGVRITAKRDPVSFPRAILAMFEELQERQNQLEKRIAYLEKGRQEQQ